MAFSFAMPQAFAATTQNYVKGDILAFVQRAVQVGVVDQSVETSAQAYLNDHPNLSQTQINNCMEYLNAAKALYEKDGKNLETVIKNGDNVKIQQYAYWAELAIGCTVGMAQGGYVVTEQFSSADQVSGIKNKSYTGKALTQSITVTNSSGVTLTNNTDYKVAYKSNKNIGKATVTISGIGDYSGTLTKTFNISPKKPSTIKVKAENNALKVYSYKVSGGVKYKIEYRRTNSKHWKSVKTSSTTKTIKKLSNKKYYYVQVEAYKVVSGKTYASSYSSKKKAKTK
jgi:hypothetical protein